MTALTLYGSSVASSTLSTADQLSTTTGGTETSKITTAPNDSSQNWMELLSQGGSGTDSASQGSPSGKGWLYDSTALEGQTIAAGNWSAVVRMNDSMSFTSITFNIRFYKRSSGGTYTSIGSLTLASQSMSSTTTTYTFSASSLSSMAFSTGDKLYIDFWLHPITGHWTADPIVNFVSNSASAGVANDFVITTPGYSPTGTLTNKDIVMRGKISAAANKDIVMRGKVSAKANKDIVLRGNIGNTVRKDIVVRGKVSAKTNKDITLRGKVSQLISKDIVLRGNIVARNASGGFTLWANGTGTASFDHFRVTQYPDPALSCAPVLPQTNTSSVFWNESIPSSTSRTMYTSIDGVNFTDVSASSGSAIPGIASQGSVITDVWTNDTHTSYTNTSKSGGSTATWTYDTTNSRITASGGSGALYLYSAVNTNKIDLLCDMDKSDAGGLAWCFVNTSNFYELGVYDDSSTSGFTNQLRLYKVSSGTRTLLNSSAIVFNRSTMGVSPYHRIRVIMNAAGLISVFYDSLTALFTYTDGSPLGAGLVGLRNDGGTSRYYQLRLQPLGDYVGGTPAGDIVTAKFVYTKQALSSTDPTATPQILDLSTSVRSPSVDSGVLVPALHTQSTPISVMYNKEFDSLARLSGDYHWNVDANGFLSFNVRGASVAPWPLYSTDLLYEASVTPSSSADLFRNRETIYNVTFTTSQTESKVADGTTTSWQMAYPLYSAPTITIGGVVQSVGIQGIDSGKAFYWQVGSASISQDSSATKLASGTIITFAYVGTYLGSVTRDNLTSQATQAALEGNSGIVEDVIDGSTIYGNSQALTAAQAQTYGDGLLTRFGTNNAIDLVATTRRSGLVVGMLLPVFLPEHQVNNAQLLVTKVTTTGQQQADGSVLYFYQIEATNGAALQNWTQALFGL